ncbi:hypothetical protein VSU19_02395 [Verrucomicrobiales bacterium BCK34]|nr:hypothetical protein [Verrucomicrobiales bacterium BCK34]
MRFSLLLLSLLIVPALNTAHGQTAQPDPTLRVTLESAYENWKAAMTTGDIKKWEATTAFSRQREIENRIISQRLPFPQTLFDDPMDSPQLGGLVSLGVLSNGFAATSTYFGRANFGNATGTEIPDNLLVLHFLKEDGIWKFDNLRLVRIGDDGEILLQIRNTDFSFLNGAEFQPAEQLPPIEQPVTTPDMIAEAWIDATGYEVKVYVNNRLTGTFSNLKITELVNGGVNKGQNLIRIESKPLPESSGGAPKVEVAIYAAADAESQANRVFHYRPAGTPEASVTHGFDVK